MTFLLSMKKAYRIRKNEEFSAIIAKKRSKASSSFIIYYDLKKEEHGRVGISVSKKLGDAVHRNLFKRRLREMVRQVVDLDGSALDYIIIIRKGFIDKSFEENKKDLEKTIKACRIN